LLEIAGANKAKLIVIAIGDEKKRMELVETIKTHFPNLQMLVRSSNRWEAYDLMNAGMLHIYRETLDTSLRVGVDVMKMLGYAPETTERLARRFFEHDEKTLKRLSAIRNDEEYISAARKVTQELALLMKEDQGVTEIGTPATVRAYSNS
jgi:CPA2 family monovalent cation:H+ antiporter-2